MIHENCLHNFDVQVNFPVEFCNSLFSCTMSWNFLKGGTSNFLLLIKTKKMGAKNQVSVLTFRIQGYSCDCNLELVRLFQRNA